MAPGIWDLLHPCIAKYLGANCCVSYESSSTLFGVVWACTHEPNTSHPTTAEHDATRHHPPNRDCWAEAPIKDRNHFYIVRDLECGRARCPGLQNQHHLTPGGAVAAVCTKFMKTDVDGRVWIGRKQKKMNRVLLQGVERSNRKKEVGIR